MNALLRHMALRLWLTGLAGGLFCLILLPWWQRIFGLQWLVVPAIVILGIFFGGTGWIMNRLGMALARRQVNEAVAWERAGMIHEAMAAFQRASAFIDSLWLSPFYRRSRTHWLYGALAKFHMSQLPGAPYTRSLVAGYLKNNPGDRYVAESWLEELISREQCSDEEHEAVARVGEALSQYQPVQQLLMQFYLANGRIDFDARQTYRRVWKERQHLESRQVHALARLLLHESIINPWALQVYLQAYQSGMTDALEGVAAGLDLVPVGEDARNDLATARRLVVGLDVEKTRRLGSGFKTPETAPDHPAPNREFRQWRRLVPSGAKVVVTYICNGSKRLLDYFVARRKWFAGLKPRKLGYLLGLLGIGGLAFLIVMAGRQAREPSVPPEKQPGAVQAVEKKAIVTDPFTIQVAAYLKARDAQRVVDQLIGQKLDAYWTQATSANRTWYQVKLSHFPTREAAQRYGRDLKNRGVIDDFFVANYTPKLPKKDGK
jgi:hypothetical protein